jgi:hypothetical protein
MAKYVRFKGGVILRHPDTGAPFVPQAGTPLEESDPIVKAYRWAFESEDEVAQAVQAPVVDSVRVEQATKRPGEKRATKRP